MWIAKKCHLKNWQSIWDINFILMTPSKTLFYLCISFIVGITLQSFIKIPQILLGGFLLLAIFVIFLSFLHQIYSIILQNYRIDLVVTGFCLLFLALGIARLQISEFNILNDTLSIHKDTGGKITLIGQVISEPKIKDTSQTLIVKIRGTNSAVLVTMDRYPEYKYLDTIKITGRLKSPPEFQDFNYKNYLQKDDIYSVMGFPKI